MSNVASTAITQKKAKTQPNVPPASAKQAQFQRGTMDVLDQARNLVENAVGQGQEINPMVYRMLGIEPQVEDRSAELQQAQGAYTTAQSNLDNANQTLAQLQSIPGKRRSPAQKKQMKQIKKQMPNLNKALGETKSAFGEVQSMPQRITGLKRMDPSQIPAESPFSPQNPLFQAQATQAGRLNEYMAGGEVDPTLKHKYDEAESNLRAKLADRLGPGYEESSIGQMALQNFARTKNEHFATYNQEMVQKYNDLAFGNQANLQNLLAGRIGLMREPSRAGVEQGGALAQLAQPRLEQQRLSDAMRSARGGMNYSQGGVSPLATGLAAGGQGLQTLFGPTTNAQGQPGPSYASQLGNWASGLGGGAATGAALSSGAGAAGSGFGGAVSGEALGAGLGAEATGAEGLGSLIFW